MKKIILILVSLDFPDEFPEGVETFIKKNGYKATVYWLQEPEPDTFYPTIHATWDGSIPATLMLNNSKKYKQFYGEQLPEKKLMQELNRLIQ